MRILFIDPPTATGEAIVNGIGAAGLAGTYPAAATATAEDIVLALQAAGFLVGVLVAATATPEAICNALIAAGLMWAFTTTTFRQDLVTALVASLEDESTANPTLLRKVYTSRPGSFGETPAAYVGQRSESIEHDSGTRRRTMDGLTVTVVDSYRDNTQTGDLLDELVDHLVDRFDADTLSVPRAIIELTNVADVDITVEPGGERAPVVYRGVVFTFGRAYKQEGRQ